MHHNRFHSAALLEHNNKTPNRQFVQSLSQLTVLNICSYVMVLAHDKSFEVLQVVGFYNSILHVRSKNTHSVLRHSKNALYATVVFCFISLEDCCAQRNDIQLMLSVSMQKPGQLLIYNVNSAHSCRVLSNHLTSAQRVQTVVGLDILNVWILCIAPEKVEISLFGVVLYH